MRVCYFGIFQKDYCRTRNIIIGMQKNGVDVLEVQDRTPGMKKFFKLYKKHRSVRNEYDFMIVGFPGQIIVPFAKLICRKPIVFDAHVSIYDSNVFERMNCSRWSLRGMWYFFLDWFSCHLADVILLDTHEHVKYFIKTFHLKPEKFIVIHHGVNDEKFFPLGKKEHKNFIVEYHGYITPLHGIEYVLHAMDNLRGEGIELWIIGGGQDYQKMVHLSRELNLNNVKFFPVIPHEKLIEFVRSCDVGLGILGKTNKVDRVIPNKLYELMAMKKPVVTADTPAIREKFIHGKHIYSCKKADYHAIIDALRALKNDPSLRQRLAENAYRLMKDELIPEAIGKKFVPLLEKKVLEYAKSK